MYLNAFWSNEQLDRTSYLVLSTLLMVPLYSCVEQPDFFMKLGTTGSAGTIVRRAVMDGEGNIIVVGSTLGGGLATEGAYEERFRSRATVRRYDPSRRRWVDEIHLPAAPPFKAPVYGDAGACRYLFETTFAVWGVADGRWRGLPAIPRAPWPDFVEGLHVSGQTVYVLSRENTATGSRTRIQHSPDCGRTWTRGAAIEYPGPLFLDKENPCRFFSAVYRSEDCGMNVERIIDAGIWKITEFDARL
jgi:hypothetical protein